MRGIPAWCLLLLLTLAPAARAQVLDPAVGVELPGGEQAVDAGTTLERFANIRNTGGVAGTVSLATQVPEGWSVTLEPSTPFSLAAGASTAVRLLLTAPSAGEGSPSGDLVVLATIQDSAGRSAQGQATVALLRVDPPPPLPPPPPPNLVPLYVAGALLLSSSAGGLAVFTRRRRARLLAAQKAREQAEWEARETGILLRAMDGPLPYGAGRDTVFRLCLTNESPRPRVAVLRVEAPEGWRATASFNRIGLPAGDDAVVSLHVLPPPDAPLDARVQIRVAAKPEEAREREQQVILDAHAPPAHGALAGGTWPHRAIRTPVQAGLRNP